MSVTTTPATTARRLAGAIAVIVLFDTVWVRAPFLAFMAIPFATAAWRYRGEHRVTTLALLAWSALYVAVGVSYVLSNGLHNPAEAGRASEVINPGDFAFAYVGTPLAAVLAVRLAGRGLRRRSPLTHAAA